MTRPRVLHASLVPRISNGIVSQLLLEKQATLELDIPWETVLYCPRSDLDLLTEQLNVGPLNIRQEPDDSVPRRMITNLTLRKAYYSWLAEVEDQFDIIMLRYSVHDHRQAKFVKQSKALVALVHHTFAIDELRAVDGQVGKIRAGLERFLGPWSLREADIHVGVTQEIADHQLVRTKRRGGALLVYPNGGPDVSVPVPDRRTLTPHLLFTASYFSTWQGLDLLLNSLPNYDGDFVLHVVGDVSPRDREDAERDTRVVLHGSLGADQIRELAQSCWIGISSLATERQGFSWACPLKVREYLSMGLPVFGNHYEVFPSDFPYYVRGRPDISSIIAAAQKWQGLSRPMVAVAATPFISKKEIVGSFYRKLEAIYSENRPYL